MLKAIAFTILLAACGVPSSGVAAPDEPDDKPPDDQTDQHWCCQSVDSKTFTGEGCTPIGPEHIAACNNVLYCEGNWVKENGDVTCK